MINSGFVRRKSRAEEEDVRDSNNDISSAEDRK
jgi:hypothetical protein